jgi:hypothetical protein
MDTLVSLQKFQITNGYPIRERVECQSVIDRGRKGGKNEPGGGFTRLDAEVAKPQPNARPRARRRARARMRQGKLLREQLDGASLWALLNTAEGHGRRQGGQRAKCFDDARGSAIECAACLDASVAKGFASLDRIKPAKKCWFAS